MTDQTAAMTSLNAGEEAQQRAQSDARWIPWACALIGLLVIPGGIVVPRGLPAQFYVLGPIIAVLVIAVWKMWKMRAMPRGGKKALNISVGCWFALNPVVGAIGGNIESLGLGMAISAVASLPFFIPAAKFRSGKKPTR